MTLISRHFVAAASCLVAVFGFGSSVAQAIPAGSNPSGTLTPILIAVTNGDAEVTATVSYDPNAGPLLKQVVINSDSFGTGVGLPAGDSFSLIEHITIDGGVPWTDWHETILSDYFTWGDPTVEVMENGVASPLGHTFELTGNDTELSVFFDDLLTAGTELLITKSLILDINAPFQEPFKGTIEIAEFPSIDEPAAMMLFGAGLLAFGLVRRRLSNR
jgi:hypothetical protein